ncbi:MAG: NADH-quinone oxidoreductase subunit H [Candidatus Omnitrophica bacterium]|nr:NADH-quinone oxidoreductase subunit H [Candidatus Omnitrophota bacterium]
MITTILIHWLLTLLFAPFFIGVITKVKAVIAGKIGPSLFQSYYDLARLSQKRSVYSSGVTWVFRLAPMIVLAAVLMVSLMIPIGIFKAPVQFAGDILVLVYLFALVRFFMIAGSLDTGFSMEGMGASREAFFSCLTEVTLFMNLLALGLLAHSISLSEMIGANYPVSWNLVGPSMLLIVASLFIVLLAENCRIPIDDPDTHLELTMIHEVMLLEHSGVDLAFMMYASAIKFLIFSSILVPIIIPVKSLDPFINLAIYLGGMTGLAVLVGCVETSMARLRLDRVRHLLLISFALAFFGLIVTWWRA